MDNIYTIFSSVIELAENSKKVFISNSYQYRKRYYTEDGTYIISRDTLSVKIKTDHHGNLYCRYTIVNPATIIAIHRQAYNIKDSA